MIRVARGPAAGAVAALGKPDRWGLSELDYALWFFAGQVPAVLPLPPAPAKPPKFKAYKRQAVKDALQALFGTRCAYCESAYSHVMPMDVEHYRPKSGFLNDQGKLEPPGYYWLASEWENLLPSCGDCNRERKQYRRAAGGDPVKGKSGKASKFPLAAGSPRANAPGGHAAEIPLLLDQCTDDPGRHLQFLFGGFAEPAATPDEAALPKGRVTIDVCGLDRSDLVASRNEWIMRVLAASKAVMVAELGTRKYPLDADFAAQLTNAENELAALVHAAAQYRALTAAVSDTFAVVRPAVDAYHVARLAWLTNPDAASTAALTTAVVAIKAVYHAPGRDRTLVAAMLGHAGIEPSVLEG